MNELDKLLFTDGVVRERKQKYLNEITGWYYYTTNNENQLLIDCNGYYLQETNLPESKIIKKFLLKKENNELKNINKQ